MDMRFDELLVSIVLLKESMKKGQRRLVKEEAKLPVELSPMPGEFNSDVPRSITLNLFKQQFQKLSHKTNPFRFRSMESMKPHIIDQ